MRRVSVPSVGGWLVVPFSNFLLVYDNTDSNIQCKANKSVMFEMPLSLLVCGHFLYC